MTGVNIGLQLASLRLPIRKALAVAANLGAEGASIDLRNELQIEQMSPTGIREFKKILADSRLRFAAATFPLSLGFENQLNLEQRISETEQALQIAYQLGAKTLITRLGTIPKDTESAAYQELRDTITRLGLFSERVGVKLTFQTLAEEPQELATFLSHIPEQTIGIDFHPGNLVMNQLSLCEALEQLSPYISHLHAVDAIWDLSSGKAFAVALGAGAADFPQLLGSLQEYDFQGWVTTTTGNPNPQEELSNSIAYLKTLLGR